jgi:hypothetical protein
VGDSSSSPFSKVAARDGLTDGQKKFRTSSTHGSAQWASSAPSLNLSLLWCWIEVFVQVTDEVGAGRNFGEKEDENEKIR